MERLKWRLSTLLVTECVCLVFVGSLQFVSGQNCQVIVSSAMKEYKDCMDNLYISLFGYQYKDMVSAYSANAACRSSTYVRCKDAAKQKVGGCLDFIQRETMEITFQAADAGLSYFCDNGGRNLLEYYRRMIPDCYFKRKSFLDDCEREYPLVNVYLNPYTTDYCRIQSRVMQCLQNVYDQCLPYESPDFMRMYFLAIWSRTPCNTVDRQPLMSGSSSNLMQVSSLFVICYSLVYIMASFAL